MRTITGKAATFLAACCLLVGQQTDRTQIKELNNESVIKLAKAGLSDDLIISTINASSGKYDTSPDGLIALRRAGVSDTVVSTLVHKGAATASQSSPAAEEPAQNSLVPGRDPSSSVTLKADLAEGTATKPRVFLQAASKGSGNAARDQAMEMSKDLEKNCLGVRITINQTMADYTVLLNHIEKGLARDNQIQVANRDGDLLTKTKEGGSIAGGMKKACALILDDWTKK
jgi:hypothetical protein